MERIPSLMLFKRAIHYLRDYGETLDMALEDDDVWFKEMRPEVLQIVAQLKELQGSFEAKEGFTGARNAADIVHSMLKDWNLPGGVWYAPKHKRFRLVGENYERAAGEVCIGIYTPEVTVDALTEDFAYIMGEQA